MCQQAAPHIWPASPATSSTIALHFQSCHFKPSDLPVLIMRPTNHNASVNMQLCIPYARAREAPRTAPIITPTTRVSGYALPVAAQVQRSERRQARQAGWQVLNVVIAHQQLDESAAAANAIRYRGHLVAAGIQERQPAGTFVSSHCNKCSKLPSSSGPVPTVLK